MTYDSMDNIRWYSENELCTCVPSSGCSDITFVLGVFNGNRQTLQVRTVFFSYGASF